MSFGRWLFCVKLLLWWQPMSNLPEKSARDCCILCWVDLSFPGTSSRRQGLGAPFTK